MARQQVDVRREGILEATVAAIEARGMAALRVADVARDLGVSSGLVFYHFDTKAKLLAAALEFAVDRDLARLDAALAPHLPPTQALAAVLASYGPTGSAAGWRIWIDAWATALREPAIRRMLRRLDDRWRAALRHVIVAGVESGDFHCADTEATVARLGGLLDGLSVGVLVYHSVSRGQLRTWVRAAAAAELGVAETVLAEAVLAETGHVTPANSVGRRPRSARAGQGGTR